MDISLRPQIELVSSEASLQNANNIKCHTIYINARSVLANLPHIEMLCFQRQPSLVFCTEARITEDICDNEYFIDGYNSIVCFAQSRFTGGVVIYVKKNLKYKVIANSFIEKLMWCLSIELLGCTMRGIYSVIYRSPAYNFNLSSELFDSFLEKTVKLNKLNIITGDVNVDMNVTNNNTRCINSLLNKHGLKLIVNFNTRVTNESQTLIDYVITNESDRVKCKPLPCDIISDHETIDIVIFRQNYFIGSDEYVMSWNEYSKDKLIRNLRNCDWSLFNLVNIDKKLQILRENLLNSVIPLTKYVLINNAMKPRRWFDSELKLMKCE